METKTFCRNNKHILEEVGKTNDGRCRACTKEAARRTYLKHHESRLARQKAANEVRRDQARDRRSKQPPKDTCRSGKHLLATSGKTKDGRCKECTRESARRNYEEHREDRMAKMRVGFLRENKPERLQRMRDYDQARSSYDKERIRGLRRHFNMTLADYSEMFLAQNGVCAICKRPETATFKGSVKPLAVDHDHLTNARRALLCANCNHALGLMKDDPQLLVTAAEYLWSFVQPEPSLVATVLSNLLAKFNPH